MHVAKDVVVAILIIGSYFFLAAAIIGLLRLPDLYNRMHAMGKCDTLGAGLGLLAAVFLVQGASNIVKVLMIMGIIFLVSPVMSHLIMKTAFDRGTPLAKGTLMIDNYAQKKVPQEEGEHR